MPLKQRLAIAPIVFVSFLYVDLAFAELPKDSPEQILNQAVVKQFGACLRSTTHRPFPKEQEWSLRIKSVRWECLPAQRGQTNFEHSGIQYRSGVIGGIADAAIELGSLRIYPTEP